MGVALIIGLKQINFAFGLNPEAKHPEFVANLWESLAALGDTTGGSVALFFPMLLILMGMYNFIMCARGSVSVPAWCANVLECAFNLCASRMLQVQSQTHRIVNHEALTRN